jgi:hypothetical protein
MNTILKYLDAVDQVATDSKSVYMLGNVVGEIRLMLDDMDLTEEQLTVLKNRTILLGNQ